MSTNAAPTFNVPFVVFLILVFSLGLMKPTVDSPFGELTPTDIIFPIAFLSWIVALASGRERFRGSPAFASFVIYLAALVVSTIFSRDPGISIRRLPGEIYLIVLGILAANLVTTSHRLRLSMLAWISGATLPVLVGIVGIALFYLAPTTVWLKEITYHYGAAPFGNFPRLNSTFVSPGMFCNYLIVSQVFVFIAGRLGWIGKKLALLLSVLISVCALFTVSITLGGYFLAFGLWIWTTSENRLFARVLLGAAAAAAIAFLIVAPLSLSSLVDGQLQPSSRMLVWKDAIATFAADPITGKGLGMAVANVTFQNSDGTFSLLTDAHNTFLSVGAQSGLIGLLGIVLVTWQVLRSSIPRSELDPESVLARRGLLIAFVAAFLYAGLTASSEDARHLWILIGIIVGASEMERQAVTND